MACVGMRADTNTVYHVEHALRLVAVVVYYVRTSVQQL